jgi:putative sugar O-methyltransferase
VSDAILKTARAHYNAARPEYSSLPSLGNRWGVLREELQQRIGTFASSVEAIEYGQLRGFFDHRQPASDAIVRQMETAQHLLAYEYPQFKDKIPLLSDARASAASSIVERTNPDGHTIIASNVLYWHAFHLLTVLRFKPHTDSICEIGGGYGNPARLWLDNPIKSISRYAIIDMPESLFFAEVFLRSALPETPLHYATDEAPIGEQPGVTLVPIHLSHQTKAVPFDMLVNTGSLGEMPDAWVAHWGRWIDDQNATFFYSHNYVANPVDNIYEGRCTLSPDVSSVWRPSYVRAMHPLHLLHSIERTAAEIIFTRASGDSERQVEAGTVFLDGVHLSIENYIHMLYALRRGKRECREVMRFARKVIDDFGYAPVELLSLLAAIAAPDGEATELRAQLQRQFDANYPSGTNTTPPPTQP